MQGIKSIPLSAKTKRLVREEKGWTEYREGALGGKGDYMKRRSEGEGENVVQ